MHTAFSESDLDHLDEWLRSRMRRPHRKLEPYFQPHPAEVALPDRERCPPKAEVVSSNLAGFAMYFNNLDDLSKKQFYD